MQLTLGLRYHVYRIDFYSGVYKVSSGGITRTIVDIRIIC